MSSSDLIPCPDLKGRVSRLGLTVAQFARIAGRHKLTVYKWLGSDECPQGTVSLIESIEFMPPPARAKWIADKLAPSQDGQQAGWITLDSMAALWGAATLALMAAGVVEWVLR